MKRIRKVAVDFDGTVVEHQYPLVGPDVPGAVDLLRRMVADGRKIILYTMRADKELRDAVAWFERYRIPLYGVNRDPDQTSWTSSPKAYADAYIDDAAVGCPLVLGTGRPYVDWTALRMWYEAVRIQEMVEHISGTSKETED